MTALLEHVERHPDGALGIYVESIWVTRGTATAAELSSPTGSTVGALVLGDPIRLWPMDTPERVTHADHGFLIGAHDRPIVSRPGGVVNCVGVVATPVGCQVAFGVEPGPIKRRVVDLSGTTLQQLSEAAVLAAEAEPAVLIGLVEAALTPRAVEPDMSTRRCQYVIAALTADPATSIDALAYRLSISHGDLDQQFKRIVGLGPRAFARVLLLRSLLAQVTTLGIDTWAAVAAEDGWFEEPLLIRDFRRHTGVTPREFVRNHRHEAPAGALPGFVPVRTG